MYRLQSSTIWNLLPLPVAQSQVKVQWHVLSAGHRKWLGQGEHHPTAYLEGHQLSSNIQD